MPPTLRRLSLPTSNDPYRQYTKLLNYYFFNQYFMLSTEKYA